MPESVGSITFSVNNAGSLSNNKHNDHAEPPGFIHGEHQHLNKLYETEKEMCAYWGIKQYIFKDRIKEGWSLEEALTIPYRL